MADRRGARSSSRRTTPTPQPPSTATTAPGARASRQRGIRSTSREPEQAAVAKKPIRRGARRASVASESGAEEQLARAPAPSRIQKQDVQELSIVDEVEPEEVESQLLAENAAATPRRTQKEVNIPHRSPGAVSEMSGTTAISSLSQFESEELEPRNMRRSLAKLYNASEEFLSLLAPDAGRIEDDVKHIKEMQKPDSGFNEDYRYFESEMSLHLGHFRSEHSPYINLRAVRRALLGPDWDPATTLLPLDILLYKANLLTFAKQGIALDRAKAETWDFLQYHDKFFPAMLLPAVDALHQRDESGTATLSKWTIDLGLEIRTRLFIVALERKMNESDESYFDPDDVLVDVFQQAAGPDGRPEPHGWDVPGLGGRHSPLTGSLQELVVKRMEDIRKYFPMDVETLERGESVNIEELTAAFPFSSFVLHLLHWVRLRNREVEQTISELGSVNAAVKMIVSEIDRPNEIPPQPPATSALAGTPNKKRVSFGRDRRRSGRKFDPNAPLDDRVVDALVAREQAGASQNVQPTIPAPEEEPDEPDRGQLPSPDPPRSTAEYTKLFKQGRKLDKENRGAIFAQQDKAERIEFGDGFEDTQLIPGPSSKSKGKQPQRPLPRKRRRSIEDEDDEEDAEEEEGAFETREPSSRAQERREKAPVAKRVRVDSNSSAPTSHQPQGRTLQIPLLEEESLSEPEAPEMTEEAPTSSNYSDVVKLSRMNQAAATVGKYQSSRRPWTEEEVEVFQDLMAEFPRKYSQILKEDESRDGVLQQRSQVNLKDKAINMAFNMIRSGVGLLPGFEGVIHPESQKGRQLIKDGFEW